jgi:hypothetical protein
MLTYTTETHSIFAGGVFYHCCLYEKPLAVLIR